MKGWADMSADEQLTEHLARVAERDGDPEAAGVIRDYPQAREYFGTSAAYVSRELGPMVDEVFGGAGKWPVSSSWLAERALVAVWRALGRPAKP